MIALAHALAARGHEVTVQTWDRWRPAIEAEGNLRFATAPEYQAFPNGPEPLDFYEAVVHATRDTLPLVRELRPDVVVADILTLAPALSAELCGVPYATLIPHVNPHPPLGAPIYSIGARLPRTAAGRAFWRRASRPVEHGLERGRRELNDVRRRVGLPPLPYVHNGTSRELALVATFPQLEYPRAEPLPNVHVVGPLLWEPPTAAVELPPGDEPLVLIAPSTSQDPEHRLLHAALRGLADAPVRVLATWNRRLPSAPAARARERAGRRVGLLRPDDAPLRRRRLPRRARHARARAQLRMHGRRVPRRRRHERERRPRRLGRRRGARPAQVHRAAAAADGGRASARGPHDSRASARAGSLVSRTLRRSYGCASRRRAGRAQPHRDATAAQLRGWDSNPQPLD